MLEFLQMGGYAFYVWSSYAVVVAVLAVLYVAPLRRRKRLLRELAARAADADAVAARQVDSRHADSQQETTR